MPFFIFFRFSHFLTIFVIENLMMLKWQLSGLQSETNYKMRPGIFGIRYYSIRSTGQQPVTFSGSNIVPLKKSYIQHRGLVVFFCEATETLRGDFAQLCIDQVIPVVAKKRIPFILCLQRNSEKAMLALDQMITAKEKLQDCLKKTHRIIQKEIIPCKLRILVYSFLYLIRTNRSLLK